GRPRRHSHRPGASTGPPPLRKREPPERNRTRGVEVRLPSAPLSLRSVFHTVSDSLDLARVLPSRRFPEAALGPRRHGAQSHSGPPRWLLTTRRPPQHPECVLTDAPPMLPEPADRLTCQSSNDQQITPRGGRELLDGASSCFGPHGRKGAHRDCRCTRGVCRPRGGEPGLSCDRDVFAVIAY